MKFTGVRDFVIAHRTELTGFNCGYGDRAAPQGQEFGHDGELRGARPNGHAADTQSRPLERSAEGRKYDRVGLNEFYEGGLNAGGFQPTPNYSERSIQ